MLLSRQYKERIIDNAVEKIRLISRVDALKRVQRNKSSSKLTFVVKFDPRMPKVNRILHQNFNVMMRDPEMKDVFKSGAQVAYKRHKNLRDILCSSSLHPLNVRPVRQQFGFKKCTDCVACKFGVNKSYFHSNASGEKFTINQRITCESRNVVYIIFCKKCNCQYVGKTINALKERINAHRYSIGTSSTPVACHFEQRGHSINDLGYFGIEIVQGDIHDLGAVEKMWIRILDVIRFGMNKYRTNK